jgi:hypothetical protein
MEIEKGKGTKDTKVLLRVVFNLFAAVVFILICISQVNLVVSIESLKKQNDVLKTEMYRLDSEMKAQIKSDMKAELN